MRKFLAWLNKQNKAQKTYILNIVWEVDELVEKIFVAFLPAKEQKRLHFFPAIEFVALTRSIDISALVNCQVLILLLIKWIAWTILVKIVMSKNTKICKIIAIVTPM